MNSSQDQSAGSILPILPNNWAMEDPRTRKAVRTLHHYYYIVDKLMEEEEYAYPLRRVIEKKIVQLEALILQVPYNERTQLDIEDWQDDMVDLWRRYAALMAEVQQPPANAAGISNDTSNNNNNDNMDNSSPILLSGSSISGESSGNNNNNNQRSYSQVVGQPQQQQQLQQQLQQQKIPRMVVSASPFPAPQPLDPVASTSSGPFQRKKAKLSEELELKFANLTSVTNGSDLPGLTALIEVVAEASSRARIFASDGDLQESLFQAAAAKLPQDMINRFMDVFHERVPPVGTKLCELKLFLGDEIAEYHRSRKYVEGRIPRPRPPIYLRAGEKYCIYCKKMNSHFVEQCPEVRDRTCFKCFKKGHKAKLCPGVSE